jgi:cyclophilin family peptidyl-prolyl cis-trans isomerase
MNMKPIRVFSIVALAIGLALLLRYCPIAPKNEGAGANGAGGATSTSPAPQAQPDASVDDAAATTVGEATEGQSGTETAGTDASGSTDAGESESGGEAAEAGGAEAGAGEGEDASSGGGGESGKLNPFPPDGGMWSRDDLGKNQNEKALVLCETDKGNILIEVYPEIAPNAAKAFLDFVGAGYYDGTYFHRVIKDFVAQGGCPLNSVEIKALGYDKTGWPDKVQGKVALEKQVGVIKDEPNFANNDAGTLALAKVGYDKDTYTENSAGAEFFINLKYNQDLDKYFTVFGKVTSGMDVVAKLTQDDVIRSMRVLEGK